MQKTATTFAILACVLLAAAGMLGAYGAHALPGKITPEKLKSFELAVQYQFFHALGVLLLATLAGRTEKPRLLVGSAGLMLLGVCLFSGSIYASALAGFGGASAVAPYGGSSFMAAWLLAAVGLARSPELFRRS